MISPSPFWMRSMIGLAASMAMAKPMFWLSWMIAVFMPTTAPLESTRGPPELPGLMAASVWIRSASRPSGLSIERLTADTMPVVTLGSPPEVEGVADGDDRLAHQEGLGLAQLRPGSGRRRRRPG